MKQNKNTQSEKNCIQDTKEVGSEEKDEKKWKTRKNFRLFILFSNVISSIRNKENSNVRQMGFKNIVIDAILPLCCFTWRTDQNNIEIDSLVKANDSFIKRIYHTHRQSKSVSFNEFERERLIKRCMQWNFDNRNTLKWGFCSIFS